MNLEQRSPEWHAWRRKGIGSSEAAILMGCTDHRTLLSLWRDKMGLEVHFVPMNEDLRRGIENEDRALALYCAEKKVADIGPLTLQHEYFDFMRASLDGAAPDRKHFVEIKCPRSYIHEKTRKYGSIKPEYFCQMQHQYFVSEYETCDFISLEVAWDEEKRIWVEKDFLWLPVEPDYDYQAELLEREILFWEHVMMGIEPEQKDFPQYQNTEGSASSVKF